MNKLFSNNDEFYVDLEVARARLVKASESISSNDLVIDSTLPSFRNHLKDTYSRLNNGFQSITSMFTKYLAHSLVNSISSKEVDKLSFIDMSTMLIQVPEGFHGNLYEYSTILGKVYPNITTKAFELSNELIIELGKIVNINSHKLSSRDLTSLYEPYTILRQDSEKLLNGFFEVGSTQSKISLGSVIGSSNEIKLTFQNLSDLERAIKGTNIHSLLDQINHIGELLKTIEDQIKIDSGSKFSPQIVKLLAEGTYECAKYYEFVSVLFYDCDVLIECVQQLNKKIKKL